MEHPGVSKDAVAKKYGWEAVYNSKQPNAPWALTRLAHFFTCTMSQQRDPTHQIEARVTD